MKNRIFIFCILLLVQSIGLAAQSYTFGDDMNNFVQDSAYIYVMRQLPEEYASRSINGFQVTMDKARKSANRGSDSLGSASTRLNAIIENTEKLILNVNSGKNVTKDEAAQLAAYATQLNSASIPLAEAYEHVSANLRMLQVLNGPLSLSSFKQESLHLVPLTFIRSAFGGAPNFNSSISVSVTVYNDGGGAGDPNGVQGGFFLFDIWDQAKKLEEYQDQMKIYYRAFDRLPEMMPADTLCYRLYSEGFRAAEKIYGEEPLQLSSYMDTLQQTLSSTYSKTIALKRLINNILLSDRVATVYKTLSLQNFSLIDQQMIQQKAYEINQARSRLIEIRAKLEKDKVRKTKNFIAAENFSATALQVLSQIYQLDSLPLFLPLRKYLPVQEKWFKTQSEWASMYLSMKSLPLVNPKGIKIPIKKAVKLTSRKKTNVDIVVSTMIKNVEIGLNPELSISYNWPGSSANQPHEGSYENGGGSVWSRNSDGAYSRDLRAAGGFMVGRAKQNMINRTREGTKNHREAVAQATKNYATRLVEIQNQRTYVVNTERNLSAGFSSIPSATLPNSSVSIPTGKVPVSALVMPNAISGKQRISTEQERSNIMVRSELTNPSPGLEEYVTLHSKYVEYARSLHESGFQQQAEFLLEAATGMRAERMGFLEQGQIYPTLAVPNIPFEPFTIVDYKTIKSRNEVYEMTDRNMGKRSRWFAAASMVTGPTTIGIADFLPKGETFFSSALDFMREGNETLFPLNMGNANKILSGQLNGSFTIPSGEQVSFQGLERKALDYALVLYEQTQVENFISSYSRQHPELDMSAIMRTISYTLRYSPFVPSEVRQALPPNFDFADFEHRVRLGQRLIDIIYERTP